MKYYRYAIFVGLLFSLVALAGCGTVGGTLAGAGEDLKRAGDWVKTR